MNSELIKKYGSTLLCMTRSRKYISLYRIDRSRDSAVGITTGYGLHDTGVGVRVPVEPRIFFSSQRSDRF
jgi:hypothetical protein